MRSRGVAEELRAFLGYISLEPSFSEAQSVTLGYESSETRAGADMTPRWLSYRPGASLQVRHDEAPECRQVVPARLNHDGREGLEHGSVERELVPLQPVLAEDPLERLVGVDCFATSAANGMSENWR
jgi:hypothetical protein